MMRRRSQRSHAGREQVGRRPAHGRRALRGLIFECALAWCLAVPCVPALAAEAADRLILGAQTHFAFDRNVNAGRVIEWLKAARIASTRDEMFWNDVEDAKGAFTLRNSAQASREVWWNRLPGVAPLLILGYGNPRYDGGGQPKSPEAVAAYAKHAAWLVGQTQARVRMVELWNEWNLKAGAVPNAGAQGSAADYVRMAAAAYRAIKVADPGVQVLVGGVGEDHPDWRWMKEAIAAGLLDSADGVSVHLYNHCDRANVGADEMLRRLERLQFLLAAKAQREVPLYLTEVGWPVHKGDCQVSEADAGAYTLRLLLQASQRPWLKGVWLYETIDGGTDPTNREQRFGLLQRDGSERPAGCMVREFGALVAARPAQVLRTGDVTVAVYQEAGRSFVFMSKPEGARATRVRLRTSAAPMSAVSAASLPCKVPGGAVSAAGAQLELRAELGTALPAVFIVQQAITVEGVQFD